MSGNQYTITMLQSSSQGGAQTTVGSCQVVAGAGGCTATFSVVVPALTFVQVQVSKTRRWHHQPRHWNRYGGGL